MTSSLYFLTRLLILETQELIDSPDLTLESFESQDLRTFNLLLGGTVWWPRTAIRNFLDNSRKFNFCNRLILKLLHFFSIKKILKMYFLFFKDNLFLKRLNSFDF